MSNFHPRRAARKAVLEALFAHQFTCDNPKKTLEGVIRTNQLKDNNLDFMDKLFHCVIDNSDFSEKLIKSHLQNIINKHTIKSYNFRSIRFDRIHGRYHEIVGLEHWCFC